MEREKREGGEEAKKNQNSEERKEARRAETLQEETSKAVKRWSESEMDTKGGQQGNRTSTQCQSRLPKK